MTMVLSSPVSGSAQTGFTSPTYTLTEDAAPASNMKQWAVTALGGTQAGVTVHSATKAFTITAYRPATIKSLGATNPITGQVSEVPRNNYGLIVRKSVTPAAGQLDRLSIGRVIFEVPAGAESNDAANVRAVASLLIGALVQISAGTGDTLISGIIGS